MARSAPPVNLLGTKYFAVTSAQTTSQLSTSNGNGKSGDFLARLIIVPASTNAGAVSIVDGTTSTITVFTGGSGSLTTLAPIPVELRIHSTIGGWRINTGSNVTVIAAGDFS